MSSASRTTSRRASTRFEAHDRIHEIVIPTEEVTEYKKGKKTVSQKKFLPGYVLVRDGHGR